ncbi:VWFC domain-containing protein [Trichonephila clavipes]|nr:VWFC domain-containing protein [Trichonephila clavipes]
MRAPLGSLCALLVWTVLAKAQDYNTEGYDDTACEYDDEIYENGEEWSPDSCTTCKCVLGTRYVTRKNVLT